MSTRRGRKRRYSQGDAFEEIQVSTGAHDITVPTSGVFLKAGNILAMRLAAGDSKRSRKRSNVSGAK